MFTGPEMSAHSNPEKKNTRKQTKQNQNQNNESMQFVKSMNTWGTNAPKWENTPKDSKEMQIQSDRMKLFTGCSAHKRKIISTGLQDRQDSKEPF